MAELAFREGIMDRIRIREPRFDEQAYLFVLSALEMCQAQLTVRRHITGVELARAARDLALERYGLMARVVLEHWGISSTADIGDIVFTLVELGIPSQPAAGHARRVRGRIRLRSGIRARLPLELRAAGLRNQLPTNARVGGQRQGISGARSGSH